MLIRRPTLFFVPALAMILSAPLSAQTPLSVDWIMKGPALYGHEPTGLRWSGDGSKLYFQWKQATDAIEKDADTYQVNRDGTGLRKLSEAEAKTAPPTFGTRSKDRSKIAFVEDGDLFVYDLKTNARHRITETVDSESDAAFTADGKRLAFMRGGNLFTLSLTDGDLAQWTDLRSGKELDKEKGTESQEWIKAEERSLLEVVRRRAEKREADEAKRKIEHPRKPWSPPTGANVMSLRLSPDEHYVVAMTSATHPKAKATMVPAFVTESAYTEPIPGRTKVGDEQAASQMVLLDVKTGEARTVETDLKEPTKDASSGPKTSDKKRALRLSQVIWNEPGTKAVLLGRAADNKDRWVFALDLVSAKLRVIATEHCDAWVGGPGASTLGWLNDDDVFFQSEVTGFSHLYRVAFAGEDRREPKALTAGKWEVLSAKLSEDRSHFWLTTHEGGPAEQHLWRMDLDGGHRQRITTAVGFHATTPSPDGQMIADLASFANRPPELFVQPISGTQPTQVTLSTTPEFRAYPWTAPPIVMVPARDGTQVPARLYKPKDWKPGGSGVIFVHGAGYLQNVHNGWSNYAREFMFHHLLRERGFLVLDLDYRGSAGYGRAWRTAIYRHMGGKDLDDQVDAAKWMTSEFGVDPKAIGIYGGSYGGFITLMAMFTKGDTFAAGAALRPVTDWAHYNHGYTSDILNEPQKDPEAYRQSSPIYFAAGLKGHLLIAHGMVDTNVNFQDSVRLAQKLIELRKENWELASYPVEDHGFQEPTSWADEYKRILKLFETTLKK